jgi:hypothetical protein
MTTDIAQVQNQVQTLWAPLFQAELRAKLLLGSAINMNYSSELKAKGQVVRVSQIKKATGQTRTVGVDADAFESEQLQTAYVDVTANKRFVAAFEFTDLVDLQSQIGDQNSEIRKALLYGMSKQVNSYLYSLVNPSTSAPDHLLSGNAAFSKQLLIDIRQLAGESHWADEDKYLFLSPDYFADLLADTTLTNVNDFAPGQDAPVIGGKNIMKRYGFNIVEDDSLAATYGLAFHKDFLLMVAQTQPTFLVSSLHSQKKFGYVISVDMIGGAALGVEGNIKHVKIYNT